MFKVVGCIATAHDLRLVVLAGLICFGVSVLACSLLDKAVRGEREAGLLWLGASAIAAGSGFWATHFIAMLSFRPGMPAAYDPVTVLAGWIVAVVGTGLAFFMLSRSKTWRGRFATGCGLGLAGVAMHYVAMGAYRTTGVFHIDYGYVTASVVAASLIAGLGSVFVRRLHTWGDRMLSGGVLTLSICSVHFVGVTALTITPDPRVTLGAGLMPPLYLAISVAATLLLAISMTVLAIMINARTSAGALSRLRELIEAMPASLAYHDAADAAVIWNRRYEEGTGLNGVQLAEGLPYRTSLEASVAAGLYPEALGREAEWIEEHMAERAGGFENRTMEQNRAGKWLRIQEKRTVDGGLISVATDVTDLKAALARAEAADRVKTEFLSNLSHELRTPLNGVVGLGDVLARTELNDQQRLMVDAMLASAQNLTEQISSILDFSEMQSGEVTLVHEAFDPAKVVREAALAFTPGAHAKGIALEVDIRSRPNLRAMGDAARMRQVLTNLLSNAVKFTETGGVLVLFEAEETDQTRRLRFEVVDTGVGFDAARADRLFDGFEQADGSMTRKFGGAGLGLALSRRIVERLGGELTASSHPGRGSTFAFTVTLSQAPDGIDAPGETIERTQVLYATADADEADHPLRVLLADDHPTNRQVVELILGATESALTSVENGAEALQAFQHGRYDLVLMDLQMPVMDGLTAMRAIREFESASHLPRTPMIALTANVLAEHVAASLAAGADRHVGKPITAARLLEEIGRAFDLQTAANDVSNAA